MKKSGKILLLFFLCTLFIPLICCSKKDLKYTEQTEETTAEIEAAMMMGRKTAREFVNKKWEDTLELINHLMRAKAVQSQYVIDNKAASAEAFDSGFISTVRSVNPELAVAITENYNKPVPEKENKSETK